MIDINKLFFELIRVAIGNAVCLSHTPTAKEWQMLYDMAKKQSLVGICFAGVQRLQWQKQRPPEQLYLQWMGMAAKIQQRNAVVDRQCIDVYEKLKHDGFNSCILKGQGVGWYYGDLKGLRQSGDIDVWVDAPATVTIKWTRLQCGHTTHDYHHIDADLFAGTQVELHFRPTLSRNVLRDLKIQKWCKRYTGRFEYNVNLGYSTPTLSFDAVFILHHIYWHVMFGGCGLRQLMDLYFVLCQKRTTQQKEEIAESLKYLGLQSFAGAVMHIMKFVFGLNEADMICAPIEKIGMFLLKDIMRTGNMGHHDDRKKSFGKSKLGYLLHDTFYGMRLLRYFPIDVLWIPFGMIYISLKGKVIQGN